MSVPFAVKTVSLENTEMDYTVFGSGSKNLIILPGLSVHSLMGVAQAVADSHAAFGEYYTVYLFDRAKTVPEDYSIRDMAADTAAAMKAIGIEKADFFGASQGGMITLWLAIDYPELIGKIVLGSTLARVNEPFRAVASEWIRFAEEKDETALLEGFVDRVYSEASCARYRDVIVDANRGITEEEFAHFIIMAKAFDRFDCTAELEKIHCPALVLGSEGDRVVTPVGSYEIAEALGCELYMYGPEYGHAVYDEAPDYRDRYLAFLLKEEA